MSFLSANAKLWWIAKHVVITANAKCCYFQNVWFGHSTINLQIVTHSFLLYISHLTITDKLCFAESKLYMSWVMVLWGTGLDIRGVLVQVLAKIGKWTSGRRGFWALLRNTWARFRMPRCSEENLPSVGFNKVCLCFYSPWKRPAEHQLLLTVIERGKIPSWLLLH